MKNGRPLGRSWVLPLWVLVATAGCSQTDSSPAEPDAVGPPQFADTGPPADSNEAPVPEIQSPHVDQVYQHGDPVPLVGRLTDDRDLPASLAVTWHSNLDGQLATATPNESGFVDFEATGLTAGNHLVTLSAIDTEGKVGQATVAFVVNGAPLAPTVLIEPTAPTTADELVATIAVAAADPNRDDTEIHYAWSWWRDGEDVGLPIPTVYAQKTSRGEEWEARVKATDPYGKWVEASAKVTIGNQRPRCDQAVILPSSGWTDTTFTCGCASWHDDDPGDTPQDTCVFLVDGKEIAGIGDCELSPEHTSRDGTITCLLTPNDGFGDGDVATAPDVLVLNSAPSPPVVELTPLEGNVLTPFSCIVAELSTDADGDSITYQTTWIAAGFANPGSTTPNVIPTNLAVDNGGAAPAKDDTLFCQVRATDGDAASQWSPSNTVVLGNAAPQGGLALVTPGGATEADTLTCAITGATEPDGQEIQWTVTWHINGEEVPGVTATTLEPGLIQDGDVVTCEATPSDGELDGETIVSKNQVVVGNAPPTAAVVAVHAPAGADGAVTCTIVEPSVDATPVTYETWWQLGQGDPFLDSDGLDEAEVAHCDRVACRVEATDGKESVSSPWAEAFMPLGSDCGDGDACTSESCAPGGGCQSAANTLPCDDGDACTVFDACSAGTCAGIPDACDDNNPCSTDGCDGATGCTHAVNADLCDDANPCTVDTCNPVTGDCFWVAVGDGTACDADSDGCTLGDSCQGGLCLPGAPSPCGLGSTTCKQVLCQSTGTDTFVCETILSDTSVPCDDGFFCTAEDTCDGAGVCQAGPPRDCSQGQGTCNSGLCDEIENQCAVIAKPDGIACDADGNGCTVGDSCQAGLCIPGEEADCTYLYADCSQGACVSQGSTTYGCELVPAPPGLPCEDGDTCTLFSFCDGAGNCAGGIAKTCPSDDLGPCQYAYCDSVTQGCVVVKVTNGSVCDDGNACTTTDVCANGICVGSGDACVEERLDVLTRADRAPALGDLGFGRYATQWGQSLAGEHVLRLSDRFGSREGEEGTVEASELLPALFPLAVAVQPSGTFLVVGHAGETGCANNPSSNCIAQGQLMGILYDAEGALTSSVSFVSVSGLKGEGVSLLELYEHAVPVPYDDGTFGLLYEVGNNVVSQGTVPDRDVLYYVPLSAGLLAGDPVVILTPDDHAPRAFDADRAADTDAFLLAWITADQFAIEARYFDALGTPVGDPWVAAVAGAGERFLAVRVALSLSGDAVLAWDSEVTVAGEPDVDVVIARYDDLGTPLVAPQAASTTPVGDQFIGTVDCFADGGAVVVMNDAKGDVSGWGVRARLYDQAGAALGPSWLAHVETTGDQRHAAGRVLAGDEWVVAFVGDGDHVYTRRFQQNGDPVMGSLARPMANQSAGDQQAPAVAADGSGQAIVVFEGPYQGNVGSEIIGRIVASSGMPAALDFSINESLPGIQSEPTASGAGGRFVVAWKTADADGASQGIRARMLTSGGEALGTEIVVADDDGLVHAHPAVTMSATYTMAVAWSRGGVEGLVGGEVVLATLDPDGELASPASPASPTPALGSEDHPGIALVASQDALVLVWERDESGLGIPRIMGRLVGLDGSPLTPAVPLGAAEPEDVLQRLPVPAVVSSGAEAVVCWQSSGFADADHGVACTRVQLSTMATVSSISWLNPGAPGALTRPDVAPLADGSFVVAWEALGVDGDATAVQLQRLSALGAPFGPRVVVNRVWSSEQTSPRIVPLAGTGNPYLVAWQSLDEDGDGWGVYARALKPE